MPVRVIGEACDQPDCKRPVFKDGLCSPCWRLSRLTGNGDFWERIVPTPDEARAAIGERFRREYGDAA